MSTKEKKLRDGNGVPVEDVREVEKGEEPYLFDADGAELRAGDYALVLDGHDWQGRVVRVRGVERAHLYRDQGWSSRVEDTWSPDAGNRANIDYQKRQWSADPRLLRRVELTEDEGRRLMLAELLRERSAVDERAAHLEGHRIALSTKIRRLRAELGEAGDA